MLKQPLLDKLTELRLPGVKEALADQMSNFQYNELSFEERLSLLIDHELLLRKERRLKRGIKRAQFKEEAVIADIDISLKRGLDKGLIMSLSQCDWIREYKNIIITGATGVGKTYLASALGHSACKYGFSVLYTKTSRLLNKIELSLADGSWSKSLDNIARTSLLIMDDWFRDPLAADQVRNLLEVFDDRWQRGSTILISQVPVDKWHEGLHDPTLADAILDRVIHNAYKIEMKGESRRKLLAKNNKGNSKNETH